MISSNKQTPLYKRAALRLLLAVLIAAGLLAPPAFYNTAHAGTCFTLVGSECDVIASRGLCYYGSDPYGNDVFLLYGNPASGLSLYPSANSPAGCGDGGLFNPSTSDPNVTAAASGDGSSSITYILITTPANYHSNFNVYYSSRAYNITSGAGSKFTSGVIEVPPTKLKSSYSCLVGQLIKTCNP